MTALLSVDDIPSPKGVPVLGNMFDVKPDRTIQSLMELVRELGPIIRLRTPVGDRFVVAGLDMIDDLCDDDRFDKLVGTSQRALRATRPSAGLFTPTPTTRTGRRRTTSCCRTSVPRPCGAICR